VIQGFSGLATVQAGSDEARPRLLRTILPDKLTAITASQAITAALLARERSGEGQHVRLSMLEAVMAFLWPSDMGSQTFVGGEPARQEPLSQHDLIYQTADGYMTVAALTDRQWAGLARVVGHPEWICDARFATPALRQQNIEARLELTQQALLARPAAEWLDLLSAEGVPCGPVLTRNEVIRHPQLGALGLVVETEHPQAGRLRQARAAARFSRTPSEIRRGAPVLGEHTREILAELGCSRDEIAALLAEGAAVAAREPAAVAAADGK
jgi:crotonobetainyl-CoA:carnitine CoA-transferase CaiB-like acyl-CoA transferase